MPAGMAIAAVEAAEVCGIDRATLLRKADVLSPSLGVPEDPVDAEVVFRLWRMASELSGDDAYGLHMAERLSSVPSSGSMAHIVGYLQRQSSTLGQAWSRGAKYVELVDEGVSASWTVDKRSGTFKVSLKHGMASWPRVLIEMAFGTLILLSRAWVGVKYPITKVCFKHLGPEDVAEYERTLGTRVTFGETSTRIVVPVAALSLPLLNADPRLATYLESMAQGLLQARRARGTARGAVRTKIDEMLSADEAPSVTTVARRLGMSVRSLQRHLSDENIQFSNIVDDSRRTMALELIAQRRISVSEIAARLGYQDPHSFRNAFHRWSGMSPRDYRRKVTAHGEPGAVDPCPPRSSTGGTKRGA